MAQLSDKITLAHYLPERHFSQDHIGISEDPMTHKTRVQVLFVDTLDLILSVMAEA